MPNFVCSCVRLKGNDCMPRPTLFDNVCYARDMHECHSRHPLILCAVQGLRWHATLDVNPSCVLSKGNDGMPHPVSSNCMYYQRDMMECHARRCLTMFAVHGSLWKSMPNIIRPCVQSKDDDGMSYPTLSERVCCQTDMMTVHARCRPTVCTVYDVIHARHRPTVYVVKGILKHTTPYIARPCVQPKDDNDIRHSTFFNRL